VTRGASPWIIGGGGAVLGGVVYFAASRLLGAPEARVLPAMVLERWRRSTE
jgi:hypothetical protein